MLYARQPKDQEQEELKRMVRREVGRVSQRAQMVLLSIRRRNVPEIAKIFGVCEPTVRFWPTGPCALSLLLNPDLDVTLSRGPVPLVGCTSVIRLVVRLIRYLGQRVRPRKTGRASCCSGVRS
jgi:hypothetical protein